MNITNELKSSQLYELLEQIQLEKFWPSLREAQITQLSHFNYVKAKDLEAIGMSKPAVRRLLDCVNKAKKQQPTRPAPPLPVLSNESKLYNKNLNAAALTTKILNSVNKKMNTSTSSTSSINSRTSDSNTQQQVSVLINPNDIQIIKNNKGQDEVLGVGNFGIVKKAIWDSHTGSKVSVAVKCLHESNQDTFSDLMNEISCMCGLNHKNLIKLYGIVLSSSTNKNIMMVTELASNGSIYYYLKKKRESNKMMPINKLYSYVFQIASGMEYLESKKLIHRDLAARNILLYTFDHVKICDFGMTRSVKNERNETFTMKENHKIPAAWFPPESIKDKVFSIKSDVWMFGVTVWEVFTLCEHPWPNLSAAQILNKIDNESQRLVLPYSCSKGFYLIVYQCWSKEPAQRPTFQMLRKLIQSTKIIEMKAKTAYKEENRLEIEPNDMVTIIDGDAAKYWWKGQNNRTLMIGHFPRAILNPQRKLDSQDISLPIKNSFIHTGHMSAGSKEKTWGNPGKIDPIFLISMNPPDLLSNIVDEDKNFKPENKTESVQIISNSPQNESEDLIDLLDLQNEIFQISYPDYNGSIDSFCDNSSKSSSSSSTQKLNNPSPQPLYINDNYNSSCYFENNTKIYYNDDIAQLNQFQPEKYQQQISNTSNFREQTFKSTNPFQISSNFNRELNNAFTQSKRMDTNFKFINQNENNSKISVDDFLNKVMNDVMNDFKNIKMNK